MYQRSSRNHYKKEDAENLFNLARDTVGVPDPSHHYAFRIRENVKRLVAEIKVVQEMEKKIIDGSVNNEDAKNIDDMKGIGSVNAAAIVSEIGSIDQFESAENLQSYGGKVPMMTGSGGKSYATGISRIRNPYLSNAVYECAVSLITHKNEEFVEIFNRGDFQGQETHSGLYCCWQKASLSHIQHNEES